MIHETAPADNASSMSQRRDEYQCDTHAGFGAGLGESLKLAVWDIGVLVLFTWPFCSIFCVVLTT